MKIQEHKLTWLYRSRDDWGKEAITVEALLLLIDELDKEAIENADIHFDDSYKNLNPESQMEHEGMMWGWQDFATKLKQILEKK